MPRNELVPIAIAARARALFTLLTMYFVEGLPFGFQSSALPLRLRAEGVSLTTLGYLGALSTPWMMKAFLAPVVDRTKPRAFGRRKIWIVPLQVCLAFTCFVAARIDARTDLPLLLGSVFFMNLFAATMDVAVDGLAVSVLSDADLGLGNAAQVAGYKLGMITAGGVLVHFARSLGWPSIFLAMGALVLVATLVTLTFDEPPSDVPVPHHEGRATFGDVVRAVLEALRKPSSEWLIALVLTYKAGEAIADVLFRPLLVDRGFSPFEVGTILATYGTLASIAGSLAGGLVAERVRLVKLLFGVAALRIVPLLLELAIARGAGGRDLVIAISLAEHFVGGALTTVVFAFMMSAVDPRVGATHFTVLSVLENVGKGLTGFFAGKLADRLGYVPAFSLAIVLSVLFLVLYAPLSRADQRGAFARAT